jgi:hypothetical protein
MHGSCSQLTNPLEDMQQGAKRWLRSLQQSLAPCDLVDTETLLSCTYQ